MKFNAVVGNPPYQENPINAGGRANPIYDKFMEIAFQLAPKVTLITPGRFLSNAGQTPKAWNEKMLNDPHLKVIMYNSKSSYFFPSVDIKGGVAITYRDENKNFGKIGVFSVFDKLNSILVKVQRKGEITLDKIVSSQGVFRFSSNLYQEYPNATEGVGDGTGNKIVSRTFETLSYIFHNEIPSSETEEFIGIIGRTGNERKKKYIKKCYLEDNNYLNHYKVLVPEANGTGAIGEVLSTPMIGEPMIGEPMIGFTDTFISIGLFDNASEANNCLKYIKTKFARAILGILKRTQHNTKSTWKYVPVQDFTDASDINWDSTIADIDRQLYKKYDLSSDEIDFIETNIRDMK